ncbi:MAG: C39 family peptidase [Candidatus Woesearchaeota archaeon]
MIHLPRFKQRPGECGPTALQMWLKYYDIDSNIDDLVRLTGVTDTHWPDPGDLQQVAREYGINPTVRTAPNGEDPQVAMHQLEGIVREGTPVIVSWMASIRNGAEDHYVVVCGMGKEMIMYADPYTGGYKREWLGVFKNNWFALKNIPPTSKEDFILRPMLYLEK